VCFSKARRSQKEGKCCSDIEGGRGREREGGRGERERAREGGRGERERAREGGRGRERREGGREGEGEEALQIVT
jgi:hypothetical protein